MDEFEIEIKRDFLQEAKDLLQSTEQSFLELEKSPSDKTLIDTIFRFAHNLKGSSRAVGFGQIAELTHKAENLLLDIKQEKITPTDKVITALLMFNDKVREMIDGLSDNLDAQFSYDELMSEFDSISGGEVEAAAPAAVSEADQWEADAAASAAETIETEAADGTLAWEAVSNAEVPFGLIISDWNMPNCSGLDFLKRVRSDQRVKKTPFVLVTAEAEGHQVAEAVKAGVDQYVVKPFSKESIQSKLESVHKKYAA